MSTFIYNITHFKYFIDRLALSFCCSWVVSLPLWLAAVVINSVITLPFVIQYLPCVAVSWLVLFIVYLNME